MKKLTLFSLMVCLCGMHAMPALSAGACAIRRITYMGSQAPDHDEFLYENQLNYEQALNGYAASGSNGRGFDSGEGHGLECDNDGCENGKEFDMAAGHVFKGNVVDHPVTYRCVRGRVFQGGIIGGDHWEPVSRNVCNYRDASTPLTEIRAGNYIAGKTYAQITGAGICSVSKGTLPSWATDSVALEEVSTWKVECREGTPTKMHCSVDKCNEAKGYKLGADGRCYKGQQAKTCTHNGQTYALGAEMETKACSGLQNTPAYADLRTGDICKLTCLEEVATGIVRGVWSIKDCGQKKAVPLTNPNKYNPAATGYKKCEANGGGGKTCEQMYPGASAARLACCRAGKSTKWIGDNKSNDKANCVCLDANGNIDSTKKWQYTDGATTGQCVGGEGDTECVYTFNATIECANGSHYSGYHTINLSKNDLNGYACDTFKQRFVNDRTVIENYTNQLCGQYNGVRLPDAPRGPDAQKVGAAQSTLKNFFATAQGEANVWKTEEGKFNTARLASDLTAGVVLGTVGGVVSGVVIKKKQIEKGFDVLHCTVGGQTIADWGDEFKVGLQR